MSDFDDVGVDPIDTELAARLSDAAPETGDVDVVLTAMRPRLVRARRRRRAGFVAVSAATLALLIGVVLGVGSTTPDHSVKVPPANRSTPVPTTGRSTVTPPDPVPHTTAPVAPDDDAGATARSGSDGTDAAVTPPPTVDDDGAGESSDSGSSDPESSDPESSSPESSSPENDG